MNTLAQKPSLSPTSRTDRQTLLRRFVQAYWLRPENALWMTLRSLALDRVAFHSPSMDISCGDGIFSFLHMGGEFDPSFDVFQSVDHLDQVRDQHADMFDAVGDSYRPPITNAPRQRIDVGSDCKASMLSKAGRLRFYKKLVEHDNNHRQLFESNSFATIYCNSAYWVENIEFFLAELARIVQPDGTIVLHVKLDSMKGYTLTRFESLLGARFLDIIDRGRMECWPSLADRATWEKRFQRAGLSIASVVPFVTRTHSHLWDIGLRPIAPQLIKMANTLNPHSRDEIKRDWVELFCELLVPFCDPGFDLFSGNDEPAELQYVLTRP